jgi:hypothetical protein
MIPTSWWDFSMTIFLPTSKRTTQNGENNKKHERIKGSFGCVSLMNVLVGIHIYVQHLLSAKNLRDGNLYIHHLINHH